MTAAVVPGARVRLPSGYVGTVVRLADGGRRAHIQYHQRPAWQPDEGLKKGGACVRAACEVCLPVEVLALA